MNACICPKGHESTEADYCSECGAKIDDEGATAEPATTPPSTSSAAETCPECGVLREPKEEVFCEICGYNFVTGVAGELPPVVSPPPPAPPEPATPSAIVTRWEIIVSVDPALREPGSPDSPAGVGPFTFALQAPANLIGRKSEARAIFPEIALPWDDAVSHRHALLQLDAAGTLCLRDIGSANGTRLNGTEVPPMTDQRLADRDEIVLGHWTRITVKAIV